MKLLVALLAAGSLYAAGGGLLFYSRAFPGSVPAYFQVTLSRSGEAVYAEAADDDNPLKLHLSEGETEAIFGLFKKTDELKRPLESPAKVAFTGSKIFRYEDGDQKRAVKFNYTADPAGRELAEWFERIGEAARDYIELERAAKYDKLGVVHALMETESSLERERLVAAADFLPLLDRIAASETYMHAARARASKVAEAIRNARSR